MCRRLKPRIHRLQTAENVKPPVTDPSELNHASIIGSRGGGQHDGYWRLLNYETLYSKDDMARLADSRSIKYDRVRSQELQEHLRRHDCGLLNYQRFEPTELLAFIKNRELVINSKTRPNMLRVLTRADNNWTFRLMDLPAELRNLVYGHYMSGFATEPLIMPTLPPLARVSKQLRTEVRPIFFANCTFQINLKNSRKTSGPWVSEKDRMVMAKSTTLFFTRLDPGLLGKIRKLRISAKFFDRSSFTVDLFLPGPDEDAVVVVGEDEGLWPKWQPASNSLRGLSSKVEAEVARHGNSMLTRELCTNKVGLEDVYALRRAVETAMIGQMS